MSGVQTKPYGSEVTLSFKDKVRVSDLDDFVAEIDRLGGNPNNILVHIDMTTSPSGLWEFALKATVPHPGEATE